MPVLESGEYAVSVRLELPHLEDMAAIKLARICMTGGEGGTHGLVVLSDNNPARSLSRLAKRIGMPKAVRVVAAACAANKIAVAIPCHRVVRNDGSLSGYRRGVERKRALIQREAKP